MSNSLGGSMFIYNGISQDYCFQESIKCLEECCDKVIVVDAGSTDGTAEALTDTEKTKIIRLPNIMWQLKHGKEKLSYFSNIAHSLLDTDFLFYLQSDEILHESCYDTLRNAIELDQSGYICKRINLWASPYLRLDVPHNRKPCSTEIIRLAKSGAMSYDDAESLIVPGHVYADLSEQLRIYHMGFVRKREVHVHKITHMQSEVFQTTPDAKLKGMDIFDPYQWFSKDDLKPIEEPLPLLIQAWAKKRVYD